MEQDDSSSCSSFPPLESSNEYDIRTVGADCVETRERVQVPGLEHNDEQSTFLMERLLSSLRQAAERARPGLDDGGVPHDPQQPQDTVDKHPQA